MRMINVIDCYHGNDIPDFGVLPKSGVMAVIHKASQGSHYRDPLYAKRLPQIVGAGMLAGAYHFLDSSDAKTQADNFIAASGLASDGPDISVWADYEDNGGNSASLHQLLEFCKIVDSVKPGVQIGIYSGNRIRETLKPHAGGHQDGTMIGAEQFFQRHRFWLAEYGPTEKIPFPWNTPIVPPSETDPGIPAPGVFLWQFTEKGRIPGLPGLSDGNFFDGTFDQLQARWLA